MSFCEQVRQQTDYYWEASFAHPFVQGIADGTLPLEKFKYYMMQDAYYLKHYTKLLALLAAKATEEQDIAYFLESATFIREAELELHRTTFKQLGVSRNWCTLATCEAEREPLYAEWIALYASEDFEQTIQKQKEMMNRFAQMPGNDEKKLTEHFKRSCYYEWQFWEMPWTFQDWQQEVYLNEPTANPSA